MKLKKKKKKTKKVTEVNKTFRLNNKCKFQLV